MGKEWDTVPKRNIPLKLISKLLKKLIKRIHTRRPASINPTRQLRAYNRSSATTAAALNTCQDVTLMWLCSFIQRGLEEIIWIICRKQIACFASQALLHGWSAQSLQRGLGMRPRVAPLLGRLTYPAHDPGPHQGLVCWMGPWRALEIWPQSCRQWLQADVCVRHAGETGEDTLPRWGEDPEVKYAERGWAAWFPLCKTPLPLDGLGLFELSENNSYFILFSSQNRYLHRLELFFLVLTSKGDKSLHCSKDNPFNFAFNLNSPQCSEDWGIFSLGE